MRWRVSFHLDASDNETGIEVKDMTVEPVEDE